MSYTRFGCTSRIITALAAEPMTRAARIITALAAEPMTRAELSWRLQIPGDQVSKSLSNLQVYKKINVCGHRPSRFGDARSRTVSVFALAVPVTNVIEDEITDLAPPSPRSDAGSGQVAPAPYYRGLLWPGTRSRWA